ncbi:MAG: hypothetical protein AB7T86_04960 [Xanthobacteraceae bacterium]
MIAKSHAAGSATPPDSVALVGNADGSLDLLVPEEMESEMTRSQLFVAAVAFRSTDHEWVDEQIEFIVEVRRQLDGVGTVDAVIDWRKEE